MGDVIKHDDMSERNLYDMVSRMKSRALEVGARNYARMMMRSPVYSTQEIIQQLRYVQYLQQQQ